MNFLIKSLESLDKFSNYQESIKNKISPIALSGLSSVGKIEVIEATKETLNKNICIVTYNEMQLKEIKENLSYFTKNILIFPKREIASYDYEVGSKDIEYERIKTLNKIYEIENKNKDKKSEKYIIITTIEAIMQNMIGKTELYKSIINIKVGDYIDIEEMKKFLVSVGYERSDLVEGIGMFSVRGSIIDIGINETAGIRIELWGDEIDSIKTFNISSQRSDEMKNDITIYPAHEYILENSVEDICKDIEKNKIEESENDENILKDIEEDIEKIKSGDYISKVDKYFNCFYKNQSSFMDYLSNDYLLFFDDINKIVERNNNIINDNNTLIKNLIEKNKYIPDSIANISKFDFEKDIDKKQEKIKRTIIYLEETDIITNKKYMQNIKQIYNFKYREIHFFKNEKQILIKEIKKDISNKKRIIILAGNEQGAKSFRNLLEEENILSIYDGDLEIRTKISYETVIISKGILSSGYENYDTNNVIITGEDFLAEEKKKRKKYSDTFKQGEKVVFADLKPGDFVVHKYHGIGEFIGINTITTSDNITKDYLKIRYKNDDMLYVPTDMLDNVRKYIGGGESIPRLNKLGSKEWENTKSKVKSNLKEVARDLIELYARRQNAKGYAFPQDTPWQKQFEDNFPYEETDDQLRCIEEVKKDMESDKPMDRLLCGDVGYGKTEVAIRAAFKAIMGGKQVAYLVPTTILANQQYEEFKTRMEEFGVEVELLNRFRTKKEQEIVIKKLKLGEVDAVIGTHRILSSDVEFKNLGFLIIDEEHRFGVKDKEKIKKIKENVDVLTMTATPIPRTLHMSIVGIRDMSVIYNPPQDRKSVQTYVLEYDKEVVKEAITKELERSGQVFYLYNKVESIIKKADEISMLVPEAKVAFAHGKMTGDEIETIMTDFINKKIDVLVCTTILEAGIDIPNANTIIVENADRLGLAQLYQIRGRVGRASRQAYAYITYKRDKLLSEVADKRLKAIKEFTEFGSGFKIAMRDLEIRGAGSLLGEMQHGHMEQVGYDTYCNLLNEVIKETQGEEVRVERDVQIDINISSYIPETYIENEAQKIEIYQDIALARTDKDIEDVIDEIIDRYGDMPKEVENLIEISKIKILARKLGIIKINQKETSLVFFFDKDLAKEKIDNNYIDTLIKKYSTRLRISSGLDPYVTINTKKINTDVEIVNEIEEFLQIS